MKKLILTLLILILLSTRAYAQDYTALYLFEYTTRWIKIEIKSKYLTRFMYERVLYWQKIKGVNDNL